MGANSQIEWTHHTFNPWRGCTKVSPGCEHCYAETLSKRNPGVLGIWGDDGTRPVASKAYWKMPTVWNDAAIEAGERRRVFCLSLGDWLEDRTELDFPRLALLTLISACQQLDWLLLTKRPQNFDGILRRMIARVPSDCSVYDEAITLGTDWLCGKPPANVWLGTSVENQAAADERIPVLAQIPAVVRFLSVEPLLGPVDLSNWLEPIQELLVCQKCGDEFTPGEADHRGRHPHCGGQGDPNGETAPEQEIHWVILGGESGPGARPMHQDWPRLLQRQCQAARVPFFFKQWGDWFPIDQADDEEGFPPGKKAISLRHDGQTFDLDEPHTFCCSSCDITDSIHCGKKVAGRLLDGREYSEFPRR